MAKLIVKSNTCTVSPPEGRAAPDPYADAEVGECDDEADNVDQPQEVLEVPQAVLGLSHILVPRFVISHGGAPLVL